MLVIDVVVLVTCAGYSVRRVESVMTISILGVKCGLQICAGKS